MRGITHHQRAQSPEKRDEHLLSRSAPPRFLLSSNTPSPARRLPAQCTATVQRPAGSAEGRSLPSLRRCRGWPRSPPCVHHRSKAAMGSSATCCAREHLPQVPRSNIGEQPAGLCSLLEALAVATPHTHASVQPWPFIPKGRSVSTCKASAA